ncbi:outer membrane beta-barrel protein [Reichenbachiella versicolor]|uniref:outer membrane beta-barrel protein n=1 Tax=Reichenbachiella versicolor TaxID=1821036 RepID=UPI000D6DD721|nr:outer membrane beta-barrel protein [Reichenbachiella versicolor]
MAKDNNSFENQWRQALDGQEIAPPSHVWTGVDAELSKMEVAAYKSKANLYKWVAAACIFLATSVSAFMWSVQFRSSDQITFTEQKTTNSSDGVSIVSNDVNKTGPNKNSHNTRNSQFIKQDTKLLLNAAEPSENNGINNLLKNQTPSQNINIATINRVEPKNAAEPYLPDAIDGWMYGVAYQRDVYNYDESYASLWAGVSLGAGSFDPGMNSSSQDVVTNEDQLSTNYSTGNAVSGGLSVGTRIASRIVVSSGLHYNAINTGNANSTYQVTPAIFASFADDPNARVLSIPAETEEVTTSNEFQYLTIPIKAGYVILDKKFNITLNSGVSSNILMNADMQSSNETFEKDNSQDFKPVYFNFLSSVEFGYMLKERYLFTVEPNYNQAISDFTNTNNVSSGKPRNFGVSMGVRYNF